MKQLLTLLLLTALLIGPAAIAQPQRDPNADPPRRGEVPRGDRPNDQADRGERGPEDRADRGDRERGERGERGGRDRRWRLTEDQLDSALAIIDRLNPELAASLRETRDESPEHAVRRIAEEYPRVYELLEMQQDDPERYELHMQSIQVMRASVPLIRQLRQAQQGGDQDAIDTLTAQVREQVEAMFDIRMAIRRLEVQDLRDRIAELEEQIAEAEEQRDQHIDERTGQVVNGDPRDGRGPRGRGGPPDGERDAPGQREDGPRRGDRD